MSRAMQRTMEEKRLSLWGRCPQAPGIYRFQARIPGSGERVKPLSRNPGLRVGARVASLRCPILRSGAVSLNPVATAGEETYRNFLSESIPAGYNRVVLGRGPLAGFEVIIIGRFSGDHRGGHCEARTGDSGLG